MELTDNIFLDDYINDLNYQHINSYMYDTEEIDVDFYSFVLPSIKEIFSYFTKKDKVKLFRFSKNNLTIKNNEIFFKSFISTSKDEKYVINNITNNQHIFEFEMEKDFVGIDVESISQFKEEREVILPPCIGKIISYTEKNINDNKTKIYKIKITKQFPTLREWIKYTNNKDFD